MLRSLLAAIAALLLLAPAARAAPTLTPVDGGPDYYSKFSSPLPSGPSYFPIATWLRPSDTQARMDRYKQFGINTLVGVECPECTDASLMRANGIHAFIQADERTRFSGLGSETSGWLLGDEQDMCCGPPGFAGGNGYNNLTSANSGVPADGKLRYANFGKGVMFWENDQDAAKFVNLPFLNVVSDDIYWLTDPNETSRPGSGIPASYGATVDRIRALDGTDGQRKPVWNTVEDGWPWSENPAAEPHGRILPAELRAAVWHSIIAGARGIIYFDHQFNGCTSGDPIRDGACYPDTQAMMQSIDGQIKALAPVLNSPSVTDSWSVSGNIRASVKWDGSHFYVIAGNTGKAATTGTFSMPCIGNATAVNQGETTGNLVIPISNGQFSDDFADGNAIHIYRIDGGSSCGLGSGPTPTPTPSPTPTSTPTPAYHPACEPTCDEQIATLKQKITAAQNDLK